MSGSDDSNKTGAITIGIVGDGVGLTDVVVPPCLVVVSGAPTITGRQWVVDRPSMLMGRIAPADILIGEGGLSKAHARISNDSGNVTITDLGATNKTAVNGAVLEPNRPYPLKNNDQVRAGAVIFRFMQKGILRESAENDRMKGELEKARRIQSSLLPSKQEARYKTVQIGGRYRTASECGGDWWWHWYSGGRAFALIGDATGHGAGAAMITSAARSVVTTMEDDDSADIERVYNTLTRALFRCAGGEISMSAFIVEVELSESRLRYINASHLPAVWLPKARANELKWNGLHYLVDGISDALGAPTQNFTIGTSPAPPGTRLVLLTDGLTERRTASGTLTGERDFSKMLLNAHVSNALDQSGFLNSLMVQSDTLAGTTEQDDDITVVAMDFY